jgi:PPK2 family polyphosphate:nucleotide phosphotransferase
MSYLKRFRIKPGSKVKLKDFDPRYKDPDVTREQAAEALQKCRERLWDLQTLLSSERQRSLLICLQALDAGGKDGTIKHVLGGLNPQGCRVAAFKKPGMREEARDYLWRAHVVVPALGEIVIFNRSHYEDVLITRVHRLVSEKKLERRYEHINGFERFLTEHDTHIVKFFLHISPEEQLKRFKRRLEDPTRQWKISDADYRERKAWDRYQEAYEEVLSRCSTEDAPWFVVPADRKWFRNLAVARILVEYLDNIEFQPPQPTVDLNEVRRQYEEAEAELLAKSARA